MGRYVVAADLLGEGLPAGTDYALVDRRIEKWEAVVEQLTRNIFIPVSPGPLVFDGNNSTILHLSLPLISVTSVIINSETTALDASAYRAATGRTRPKDDRRNPKIELLTSASTSIYVRSTSCFMRGLDQTITAMWGFVEDGPPDIHGAPTYLTPRPIKDAIIQLVMRDLDTYYSQEALGVGPGSGSQLTSETTDGHSVSFAAPPEKPTWASIPNAIRDVLLAYRAPISIGVIDPSDSNKVPFYTANWASW